MIIRATRRDLLRYGSATALASLPEPAIAQAWPTKPIRIVCTYPAGGLTDIFSRAYGEYVAEKIGQPVIVENKAGAAGAIGAEIVKQSPPDGYTLMFTNSTTMVQNKALFKKLPYDPDKDFALVAWFNTGHLPTIVNKDVPAYALMVGVPARQIGWMSEFGEQLQLPREGEGEATCSHTGDTYILNGTTLTRLAANA